MGELLLPIGYFAEATDSQQVVPQAVCRGLESPAEWPPPCLLTYSLCTRTQLLVLACQCVACCKGIAASKLNTSPNRRCQPARVLQQARACICTIQPRLKHLLGVYRCPAMLHNRQVTCSRPNSVDGWVLVKLNDYHAIQDITTKCARLEQELRKSKRREEKLTALQYRLKEDVRIMGADARSPSPSLLVLA